MKNAHLLQYMMLHKTIYMKQKYLWKIYRTRQLQYFKNQHGHFVCHLNFTITIKSAMISNYIYMLITIKS